MTDSPNPNSPALAPLLELLLDGSLSSEQWDQLREILATNPAAAEQYIDFVTLHALLESELEWHGALQSPEPVTEADEVDGSLSGNGIDAGAVSTSRRADAEMPSLPISGSMRAANGVASPAPETQGPTPARRRRRRLLGQRDWKTRGLAAAIAVLATSVAWILFGPKSSTPQTARGPDSATHPYHSRATGRATVSPVDLKSGFTRLTLDGNVEVLIEGPAEYEVLSGSRLRLNSGRLTAVVPHAAVGFTVVTNEASITDLGTEFGVIAGARFTETEVFEGRVAVVPEVGEQVRQVLLSADQANRVDANGRVTPVEADPALLVRVGDHDARTAREARNAVAFERWSKFSRDLRRWPGLVAYYDFQPGRSPEVLPDASGHGHDGRLGTGNLDSAPTWSTGRWPQKQGLLFQSAKKQGVIVHGDRAFNDMAKSITIAAWIKPDPPDSDRAGIIVAKVDSDDQRTFDFSAVYNESPAPGGAIAPWSLYFAGPDYPSKWRRTPSVLPRDGRWMFVAVTSKLGGETRFYVNGKLVSVLPAAEGCAATLADVVIGCSQWSANRDFNGTMDELALFDRPLDDKELGEMYDAGKPE